MLAFIVMFLPALVMVVWRYYLFHEEFDLRKFILEYGIDVLLLNTLVIAIAYLFFGSDNNVAYLINNVASYALKYILLSMAIALGIPLVWKYRGRFSLNINERFISKLKGIISSKYWLYIFTLLLFLFNMLRCFTTVYFHDEPYSVNLVSGNISEILSGTAADVHPPLYYLWLKVFQVLFNGNYQFASLITYGVILLVGIIWIRKKFGTSASYLFVTLATFLNTAIYFNVQVRMYSMASMFVLLSFVELYNILEKHDWKSYLLFALFSLGAAYTHYYALFTVAFFYLFLIIYMLIKKEDVNKILITSVITIAGYFPWLKVLIEALALKVSDEYWISSIPSAKDCLLYLFNGNVSKILLVVFIILIVVSLCGCFIKFKYNNGTKQFKFSIDNFSIDTFNAWVISGIFAIVGTIALGIIVSKLIRPVFIVRYLYPACIIAWILLVACLSKIKLKNVIAIILTIFIIINQMPSLTNAYSSEKEYQETLDTILELTQDMEEDSYLILEFVDFFSICFNYIYYPEHENQFNSNDAETIIVNIDNGDFGDDMWVIMSTSLTEEQEDLLEDDDYEVEFLYQGRFGEYNFVKTLYLYHIYEA